MNYGLTNVPKPWKLKNDPSQGQLQNERCNPEIYAEVLNNLIWSWQEDLD